VRLLELTVLAASLRDGEPGTPALLGEMVANDAQKQSGASPLVDAEQVLTHLARRVLDLAGLTCFRAEDPDPVPSAGPAGTSCGPAPASAR
jgi:hypothetical protein